MRHVERLLIKPMEVTPTKYFGRRRRLIAGLRSQLSVNGEIVFECTMWGKKQPPILHYLRRHWVNTGPRDEVILRLIYREFIIEYIKDPATGRFTFLNKYNHENREQYENGFMPGTDGRCSVGEQAYNDQEFISQHLF